LAFAVMTISIVVDFSRSRMLYRMAANTTAGPEADGALPHRHLESGVVIVGLLVVKIASFYPALSFLQKSRCARRAAGLA